MLCIASLTLLLQLFGQKLSRQNAEKLISTIKKSQKLVATTGVTVLLDIYPILRHVMRSTYRKLQASVEVTNEWFTNEINMRKVRNSY